LRSAYVIPEAAAHDLEKISYRTRRSIGKRNVACRAATDARQPGVGPPNALNANASGVWRPRHKRDLFRPGDFSQEADLHGNLPGPRGDDLYRFWILLALAGTVVWTAGLVWILLRLFRLI
jgi:hypothetical protein